jgi:hypothetical protein
MLANTKTLFSNFNLSSIDEMQIHMAAAKQCQIKANVFIDSAIEKWY